PVGRDVADESPAEPGQVMRILRPAPHGQTDRIVLRSEKETGPGGRNALESEKIGQDIARAKIPRRADGPESAVPIGRLGRRREPDLARLRAPVEAGASIEPFRQGLRPGTVDRRDLDLADAVKPEWKVHERDLLFVRRDPRGPDAPRRLEERALDGAFGAAKLENSFRAQ